MDKDFKIKLDLNEESNSENKIDNLLKEVNNIFDSSESSINQTHGLLAFSIVSHIIINSLNKN